MDPCPFIRLTIENLALKVPLAAKTTSSVVHPSSSPCFCKIKLKNFLPQTAAIPYIPLETTQFPEIQTLAATFHLNSSDIQRLPSRSIFASKPCLKILIYTGRAGAACGVHSGRLLAKVSVPLDLPGTQSKPCVFHNGWISVGKGAGKSSSAQFHLNVKAKPDPRFVFQFDGGTYSGPISSTHLDPRTDSDKPDPTRFFLNTHSVLVFSDPKYPRTELPNPNRPEKPYAQDDLYPSRFYFSGYIK